MPEITVTTTVTFDPRKVWYKDAMLSGSSYWAEDIEVNDDGITLFDHVEGVQRSASWQNVGNAIAMMAGGRFRNYDDSLGEVSDYTARGCRDLMARPEDADWDSVVDDLILQMAVIGKVIYG